MLFVVMLGLALALVWPSRLGGASTFVIVKGSSMEPTYHSGDLLYARSARSYRVGDVVVYRIPKRGTGAGEMVVHRIRGRTADGRYVMQGDNRSEDDGAFPSASDFVARPRLALGPLPAVILLLMPWLMMLVCAIVLCWYLWPTRSGNAAAVPAPVPAGPLVGHVFGARRVSATVAVVLAFSGLVVFRQIAPGHTSGRFGSSQIAAPSGEITFSTGIDFRVRP